MASNDYLYPVYVKHLCGHEVKRMEGGTRLSRERLARELKQTDCLACRGIKGGREVIQIDGQDFVLPAMSVGSPAQIKWAVQIRRKVLTALLADRRPGENPVELMLFLTVAKWWIDKRTLDACDIFNGFRKAA